jgi:hypothetical protein
MIPPMGPQETGSEGERTVYSILANSLSDDFTVIHSLPWLSAAVRQMDASAAPTGEIDFLVLHSELGALVLEVKSGRYRVDGTVFVLIRSNKPVDVVRQTRNNFHGLTQWLGKEAGLHSRIGYGFVFPDSQFGDALISTAMADVTVDPPSRIFIDRGQMPDLAARVMEIMRYWKQTHGNADLGSAKVASIVRLFCPEFDGTPTWGSRIVYDGKLWLRLTAEQAGVVDQATRKNRMIASGWPGTGKTLVGIEAARRLDASGKRVLIVTFNNRLAEHIQQQVSGSTCTASTWHKLCTRARRLLKLPANQPEGWFKKGCCEDLQAAIDKGLIEEYDALIIDEAQALQPEWCSLLTGWFDEKQIIAFCDESQVFAFEHGTNLETLCRLLNVPQPFSLTAVLRMPRAVTDRLLSVRSTNYQLTSPREQEPDTIRELLDHDGWSALQKEVAEFKRQGVEGSDICVLLPSEPEEVLARALEHFGVSFETVGRFRGLESPVIIVPAAAHMDDTELFCAYSRATTACVAIYDTEKLAWHAGQEFHRTLIASGDNRDMVEKVRIASMTKSMMAGEFEAGSLSLQTIDLAWSPSWKAWLVALDSWNHPAATWLDYLAANFPWPIFYWHADSRRQVYLFSLDGNDSGSITYGECFYLIHCGTCNDLLPHTTTDKECVACAGRIRTVADDPSSETMDRIRTLDKTLTSSSRRDAETKVRIRSLPVSLAAAAARRYAFSNGRRKRVLEEGLPSGKLLYRSALAFAQSRIALLAPGATISIDELTDDLRERYESIAALERPAWRSVVANALATCFQKKLLTKRDRNVKGVYVPVDDP